MSVSTVVPVSYNSILQSNVSNTSQHCFNKIKTKTAECFQLFDIKALLVTLLQIRMDTVNSLEWTNFLWTIALDLLKKRRMRFLLGLDIVNGIDMEPSVSGGRVGGCQKTQDRYLQLPQVKQSTFCFLFSDLTFLSAK